MTPEDIIHFWADEVGEARWFQSDPKLDSEIAARSGAAYELARDGTLMAWEETPEGALALLLLLDQFPRNIFRGRAQAFATDAQARAIARRAIARGFDLEVAGDLRAFFYLPFMHSEHMPDQELSVTLITERLGRGSHQYPYALAHRDVIAKFGRFPGRNAALGRISTPAEVEFLNSEPLF
jgi:uncharacterized protein (DUF924 family)